MSKSVFNVIPEDRYETVRTAITTTFNTADPARLERVTCNRKRSANMIWR